MSVRLTFFLYLSIVELDCLASETIDADFTDSVSLILHQLQQEQKQIRLSSSIIISEEDTDDDEIDAESVVESIVDQTHRSSTSSVFVPPVELSKSIQTDLSFSSKDNISFTKIQSKRTTPIQPAKKRTTHLSTHRVLIFLFSAVEKRPITPVTNPTKRPIAKKLTTNLPAKKTPLNSAQSVTSLPSQSSRNPTKIFF